MGFSQGITQDEYDRIYKDQHYDRVKNIERIVKKLDDKLDELFREVRELEEKVDKLEASHNALHNRTP